MESKTSTSANNTAINFDLEGRTVNVDRAIVMVHDNKTIIKINEVEYTQQEVTLFMGNGRVSIDNAVLMSAPASLPPRVDLEAEQEQAMKILMEKSSKVNLEIIAPLIPRGPAELKSDPIETDSKVINANAVKVEPEFENFYEGLEDVPLLDLLDFPYPLPQEDPIIPTTPACPSPSQPDFDAEADEVIAGGCVVDESSFPVTYPMEDDSDYDPEDGSTQRLSRKRRLEELFGDDEIDEFIDSIMLSDIDGNLISRLQNGEEMISMSIQMEEYTTKWRITYPPILN